MHNEWGSDGGRYTSVARAQAAATGALQRTGSE